MADTRRWECVRCGWVTDGSEVYESRNGHLACSLCDGFVEEFVPRATVDEAVAFMRNAGPGSDPNAWHAFMERYDAQYEQSAAGRARRALDAGGE
jgi:hypothetical protein